ncbi:MAG: hypothetical protein B6U78_02835 [Candidatus Aenigmarchaeota archaeon ex4484_224]|nr:MAG: hypothetical protein B6U78_02835 [Candidatus Aenigmarchaeota archaeon ex4484_224]
MKKSQKFTKKEMIFFAIFLFLLLVSIPTKNLILFVYSLLFIEKCFIGRINPLGGIEFTTLGTILITLKYGISGGILFIISVIFLPAIVNSIIGSKLILNPDFNPFSIGPGNVRDFISVFLVYIFSFLDILWISLIVSIFKNFAKFEGFFESPITSIPINIAFNLAIFYYLHDFLLSLII